MQRSSEKAVSGNGLEPTPPAKRNKWERYRLPDDLTGKSFLDVGCWEGINCGEAAKRGARKVVGIDLCTSQELCKNVATYGFEFIQMDVLSEKWLELDEFDVVLCSGVLYHVENVISLLFRLRKVTRELLVLETATRDVGGDEPLMLFKSDDQANNPSNWWVPNRSCLREMVRSCGFDDPREVHVKERPGGHRVCVHTHPVERDDYARVLPRKASAMSLEGGNRNYDDNRGKRPKSQGRPESDGPSEI